MCFLSLYSSLFTIFLHLFATILKAGSAINIQQFCNLMQNICNWKSIFQSNYKKIAIIHHTNPWLQTTTPLPRWPWDSNPWPLGCQPSALSIPPRDLLLKNMKIYLYEHISDFCNLMQNIYNLTQNICNWKSISQFRHKIFAIENLFFNPDTKQLQTCCRNVGFCKKYTKKLQTFYKICVETQKINISILSAILLQKHCISIKKICICKDFRHSAVFIA